MKKQIPSINPITRRAFALSSIALTALTLSSFAAASAADKDIKSYCLDFNWGGRRSFAAPGTWAGADPAAHFWGQFLGSFWGQVSHLNIFLGSGVAS